MHIFFLNFEVKRRLGEFVKFLNFNGFCGIMKGTDVKNRKKKKTHEVKLIREEVSIKYVGEHIWLSKSSGTL